MPRYREAVLVISRQILVIHDTLRDRAAGVKVVETKAPTLLPGLPRFS
jgi:hypothetical protein